MRHRPRHHQAASSGARVGLATLWIALTGCATIDPTPRINETADIVERQTGHRPDWEAPWDDDSPAWKGEGVLTAEQAVALALRHHRELRADLALIGRADAELVQAGLLQNPVLNFMVMFPESGGRAMLRSGGFPMQALQDLWLRPSRQRAAAAELQQTVLRAADRAVEIAARVKRLYARLQYAQRALELIQANMEIVEQTRRLILARHAAGEAALVEVNVARIRYLRLVSERMGVQAEYKSLQRELLEAMGLAEMGDSWRVTPIDELKEELMPPKPEADWLPLAAEQRLDLQAAAWGVAAAVHEVEWMRREGWPDVAVGLTFERAPAPRSQNQTLAGRAGNAAARALSGAPDEGSPPFRPGPREIDWTTGPMIELEVPIFDRNQAQIARAIHEYRARLAEYEAKRQSVAASVREAAVRYEQAVEQARFFRDAVLPEVESNLELARESYRAGRQDLTVLLQVQEDLILTRLSSLGFLREALIRRADLERQVGGRLTFEESKEEDETAARIGRTLWRRAPRLCERPYP